MLIIILSLVIFLLIIFVEFYKKNIHIWFFSYLRGLVSKKVPVDPSAPINILFCFVDHFEPKWKKASYEIQKRRVELWFKNYPAFAKKHIDSDGVNPQHTFFYAAEEYEPEFLEMLADLCLKGFGEVQVHLHHDNDNPENFKRTIFEFKERLMKHGLSKSDSLGDYRFCFIHGNWALDNSRRDGRWCGINNELLILKEIGCCADFTLPSAPSETQTSKIISIYYAIDDPERPKSHNSGYDLEYGKVNNGDLLIIQGPLTFNWKKRKFFFLPTIENASIDKNSPPSKERIDLWIKQHIHVKGQPNWIFVKVHTHGCQEENSEVIFGEQAEEMYSYLETRYNDGKKYKLHYVKASEMYQIAVDLTKKRHFELKRI